MKELFKNKPVIRIGIADDHKMFTHSLTCMLNNIGGLEVIFSASCSNELFQRLKMAPVLPDILLIEVEVYYQMATGIVRETLSRYPTIRIIALSARNDNWAITQMLKAGCSAYLQKDMNPVHLENAIFEVYKKGRYSDDAYNLRAWILKKYAEIEDQLSFTEKEIRFLQLMSKGYSHKEVAVEMNMPVRTVDNYRSRIFARLRVDNRVCMVLEALRRDLIKLNPPEKKNSRIKPTSLNTEIIIR